MQKTIEIPASAPGQPAIKVNYYALKLTGDFNVGGGGFKGVTYTASKLDANLNPTGPVTMGSNQKIIVLPPGVTTGQWYGYWAIDPKDTSGYTKGYKQNHRTRVHDGG